MSVHHKVGVLDSPDQAEAALRALMSEEQFTERDLELLSGEAGQDHLDFAGERHGLLARHRRQVQKKADEYEHARRYEDELLRGRYLLPVHVGHEEQAWRVCHLLRSCGGQFIHHYGPDMVQQCCPDLTGNWARRRREILEDTKQCVRGWAALAGFALKTLVVSTGLDSQAAAGARVVAKCDRRKGTRDVYSRFSLQDDFALTVGPLA